MIMILDKTKENVLAALKLLFPMILQNNDVYKITSYVRNLQQWFNEHVGNKGLIKAHFTNLGLLPQGMILLSWENPEKRYVTC